MKDHCLEFALILVVLLNLELFVKPLLGLSIH